MSETTAIQSFSGIQRVGFGSKEAARTDQIPKFSGKEGETARIAIIDPALLLRARAHFPAKKTEGVGYVLCKSTYREMGDLEVPDTIAYCCKALPESKIRMGTLIVKYDVNPRNGNVQAQTGPDGKPDAATVGFTPMAWIFSPTKYEAIADLLTAEYDLGQHDLIITCEDEEWQRLKITPAKTRIMNMPGFVERHGARIKAWVEFSQHKLAKEIAREYTDQELLEKLGGGTASAAPSVPEMKVPADIAAIFD